MGMPFHLAFPFALAFPFPFNLSVPFSLSLLLGFPFPCHFGGFLYIFFLPPGGERWMCASRRTPPSAVVKSGGGGNCGGAGGGGTGGSGRKSVSKSREILNLLGPESGGKVAETEDPPGIMTRSRFVDCVEIWSNS